VNIHPDLALLVDPYQAGTLTLLFEKFKQHEYPISCMSRKILDVDLPPLAATALLNALLQISDGIG
jgi:hypothetical protein